MTEAVQTLETQTPSPGSYQSIRISTSRPGEEVSTHMSWFALAQQ